MPVDAGSGGEPPLSAEEIAARSFHTAFRGFDPVEVRAFLEQVSEQLRRGTPGGGEEYRVAEEAARAMVASATDEASAILRQARDRAESIEVAATEKVALLVAEAGANAVRIAEEAAAAAAARARQADEAAQAVRADADDQAVAVILSAKEEADAIVASARQRGREMIEEAQAARARMLADLARRKRAAQAHIDQLQAVRDRLVEALLAARRTVDAVSIKLEAVETSPRPVAPAATRNAGADASDRAGSRRPTVGLTGGSAAQPSRPRPRVDAPLVRGAAGTSEVDIDKGVAPPGDLPAASLRRPPPREERRSSALRILRRARPADSPAAEAQSPSAVPVRSDIAVVSVTGAEESVRVILPASSPGDDDLGAATEDSPPAGETREQPAVRTSQVPPSLPVTPDSPPVAKPDAPAVAPAPAPEIPPSTAGDNGSPPPAPAPEIPPSTAGDNGAPPPETHRPAASDPSPRVADLFARLRADGPAAIAANGDGGERHDDRDESLLQRRDAAIESLEADLVRRLKRALQDEQNDALDRIRTSRGVPDAASVLPSRPDQQARYRDVSIPFLTEAVRAGAATGNQTPMSLSVDDLAGQLALDLAEPLRARLERVAAEARRDDGGDASALSERFSSVYREWKTQRVAFVGTHYLAAAYARGAFVSAPDGTSLRWVVDDDGPCPDCDDNALAGPVPRGERFPTGQLHPPAHLGCRCLLSPAPP